MFSGAIKIEKVCPICGKLFIGVPRGVYCSKNCANAHSRMTKRAVPTNPQWELRIMAVQARSMGISYGRLAQLIADGSVKMWTRAEYEEYLRGIKNERG